MTPTALPGLSERLATLEGQVDSLADGRDELDGWQVIQLIATVLVALVAAFFGGLASFAVSERSTRTAALTRKIETGEEDLVALRTAEQELNRNVRLVQMNQLQVGGVWIPLQRAALDNLSSLALAARSATDSPRIRTEMSYQLAEAFRLTDHYNTLAEINNAVVLARSSAIADQAAPPEDAGTKSEIEARLNEVASQLARYLPLAGARHPRRAATLERHLTSQRQKASHRPTRLAGIKRVAMWRREWWSDHWALLLAPDPPASDATALAEAEAAERVDARFEELQRKYAAEQTPDHESGPPASEG